MCFFKKYTLTHPEESKNSVPVTDINAVLNTWLSNYSVPGEYWGFWKNRIDITLDESIDVACSWESDGIRHIKVNPYWLNPGVIAHEQAHNSYALLTEAEKTEFSTVYTPLKTSDPLIKYLFKVQPYGLTNDIEGHAEIYRYLGESMPAALIDYYPKLF